MRNKKKYDQPQNSLKKYPNMPASLILNIKAQYNHQPIAKQFLLQEAIVKPDIGAANLTWYNQSPGDKAWRQAQSQQQNTASNQTADNAANATQMPTLKIDTVRQVIQDCHYGTYAGGQRALILLYADTGSPPAQNALLKILEEPPAQTQIILTANQPSLLLPTIQSRCVLKHVDLDHHRLQQTTTGEKNKDSQQKSSQKSPTTKPTNPQTASAQHSKTCQQLLPKLLNPKKLDYSHVIDLSKRYKKRDQALQLVTQLMGQLQQSQPAPIKPRVQQLLLTAYNQLQANFNVRLTLEHCLFNIKQIKKVN